MCKKLTKEEFIERSIQKHGNKYNYSKVEYNGNNSKTCIICSKHGEFWQRAADHMLGRGCPSCGGVNKSNTSDFINKAKIIFPFYDYSKVEYINSKVKVCIVCPEHGEFWTTPNAILSGYGCRKCGCNILKTNEEFIKECSERHNNKYDYTLCDYTGAHKKVKIICHEKDKNGNEHGIFEQLALNHLNGSGCPRCNSGKKSRMEENIGLKLGELNIIIKRQKTFPWLKFKKHMYLDFFLPEYNIGIEVQGDQHYLPIQRFGGIEDYEIRKFRDKLKQKLCEEHGIKIYYITKKNYDITEIVNMIHEKNTTNKK